MILETPAVSFASVHSRVMHHRCINEFVGSNTMSGRAWKAVILSLCRSWVRGYLVDSAQNLFAPTECNVDTTQKSVNFIKPVPSHLAGRQHIFKDITSVLYAEIWSKYLELEHKAKYVGA